MGDSSGGDAGPSGIKNLKELLQKSKKEYKESNPTDKRWPCPFCPIKEKTLIRCKIHVKNEHPTIYNANEEEFSQFYEQTTQDSSINIDLNEFLKLVSEDNLTENVSRNDCTVNFDEDDNLKKCIHCPPELAHKSYRGIRGLKIHHCKMHKEIEFLYHDDNTIITPTSIQYIERKIGQLNKDIKIIKRIPKGARITAAIELAKIIDPC